MSDSLPQLFADKVAGKSLARLDREDARLDWRYFPRNSYSSASFVRGPRLSALLPHSRDAWPYISCLGRMPHGDAAISPFPCALHENGVESVHA